MRHLNHQPEQGFTIIELLIATLVFSIILLLVTYGILQVGATYYEGFTKTKTQQTAQAALDTITQDIQFNSGNVSTSTNGTSPYVICVGNDRYSVRLGVELTDISTSHALIQDVTPTACVPVGVPPSGGAIVGLNGGGPFPSPPPGEPEPRELLAPFMRVAALTVCTPGMPPAAPPDDCSNPPPSGSNLYQVHIRIVYGDDSVLLSSPSPNSPQATCQGGTINQFCAVADLTTTVERRL